MPVKIFFSYSHKDEALGEELEKRLRLLERQGIVSSWHDRDISAGTEWEQEISEHLTTAQIILLAVSPDFIASDFCYESEMRRAIERHEAGEAFVIPIILRPSDWHSTPFGKLQALPKDGKPITSWTNQDEAFLDVIKGIRQVVEKWPQDSLKDSSSTESTKTPSRENGNHLFHIWNVPFRRNPFFTGREVVLKHLHDTFTSGEMAVLTQPQAISGLGGMGKTQIAIEYAYLQRNEYQVVLWAKADTREALISSFVTFADLLNLPAKNSQEQDFIVVSVKRWLHEHTGWLLILDNVEDLKMVQEFLPSESSGHILLTTRTEATEPVAKDFQINQMDQEEGAEFLLRRAGIIGKEELLNNTTPDNQAEARRISSNMDGLPLALDQAGAYIYETKCSLSDYLTIYEEEGAMLRSRRGDFDFDYPQSVATTWSLSFQKVEQANRIAADLLRLCAFLSPDAIPEEIITEAGLKFRHTLRSATNSLKLNDAIRELRRYSLIRRDSDTKTLAIHRLVQIVIKDGMNKRLHRHWAEIAVRIVNQAFLDSASGPWSHRQRYLPHAQICTSLIQQYKFSFKEAIQLLNLVGRCLHDYASYREAEILYLRALTTSKAVLGEKHPYTATILDNLAELYYVQGLYKESESLYQQALAICEHISDPDNPSVGLIRSLNNLADFYRSQGKFEEAAPLLKRSLAICETMLGPEDIGTAETLDRLAKLYYNQGQYAFAEPLYQRALIIREKVFGTEHSDTADSLSNLAVLYHAQDKYNLAKPFYQKALAIYEKVLGSEHPYTATILDCLARIYQAQDQYAEVEPLYQRALAIREKTLAPGHPYIAISLESLGLFYQAQGEYQQAESLHLRALAIQEKALGPEHPDVALSLDHLATVYQAQGQYIRLEALYRRALEIREKTFGLEHTYTIKSLHNLASFYRLQGLYDQAEPLYHRLLTISEKVQGTGYPDIIIILEEYADILTKLERIEEAAQMQARIKAMKGDSP